MMRERCSLETSVTDPRDWRSLWTLDPEVTFLNHGSFGACPIAVLEEQSRIRAQLEAQPCRFFVREFEPLLDSARTELAHFIGADPEELAFVSNATAGVNTVLQSLRFRPGDELLVTDHEYNACRNVLNQVAARDGARVVVANVPFPLDSPDQVVAAIMERVTARTQFLLLDHITSQTALILPIEEILHELRGRDLDVMIDGAHAPGTLPLAIRELGPVYYTGNCHKWLCAPKGAAFLSVPRERQSAIHPIVISHGANSTRTDRSRFRLEFDWTGTDDPTAALSVPAAIRFLGGLLPGGWPEWMDCNRQRVLAARREICARLGLPLPAPDSMIGSMASIPIWDGEDSAHPGVLATEADAEPVPGSALELDPLQELLWQRWKIEVPVVAWPGPPKRLVRISAQQYNRPDDYTTLARALRELGQGPD